MGILKDMYTGNQNTFGEFNIRSKEHKAAVAKLAKAEAELLKRCPEVAELVNEFEEAQGKVMDITVYQAFETGFRAGAQIMAEMLKPLE